MMEACSPETPAADNAALGLGLGMAVLAESGRDKLTFLTSPGLESFGDWAEQLVAESTGKEGIGIVPVVREGVQKPAEYGPDRFFTALLLESAANDKLLSSLSALEKAGHPKLFILDSTDPARVKDIESAVDLAKTVFIVSSKSGGTVELLSSFKYFFHQLQGRDAENPGR